VEMLGVLAIIGVLSVGAIAGYSKAMEKWEINKNLTGYNHLIFGLMGYYNELSSLSPDDSNDRYRLEKTINKLNLLPEGWKYDKSKSEFRDFLKNRVIVFARRKRLAFDIYLNSGSNSNYNTEMCTKLISFVAKPLASDINHIWIWPSTSNAHYFYGDQYCGGNKTCLSRTILTQIESACSSCNEKDDCTVVLEI
jgi:type II secretory pathway pseudopilin PulG